jgi:phosphatidylinositol 4-kinase B
MPMWCSSADKPDPTNGIPEAHHRIVRIPPGESVVLNSAERAPYLLLIEILHGDLDFDPNKRSNKEVLKKIVMKENERKGASSDLITFSDAVPMAVPLRSSVSDNIEVDTTNPTDSESLEVPTILSPTTPSSPAEEDEEIDLVEQVYGEDDVLRPHEIDLSESIVLPPQPKNKELDNLTWSSTPATPIFLDEPSSRRPGPSRTLSSSIVERSQTNSEALPPSTARVLSLDEYSERMRTAAVMLAQLNSNLTPAGPVPGTTAPESTSPLRWLPGGNWLTVTPPHPEASQSEPSASSHTGSSPMRMRLAPVEAQAIRNRIMNEMLALEEERMERMRENRVGEGVLKIGDVGGNMKSAEDEGIIRRELSKADPSAVVVGESWAAKKVGGSDVSRSDIDVIDRFRAEYDKYPLMVI